MIQNLVVSDLTMAAGGLDHCDTRESYHTFIRSGQNHLARHSDGGRRQGRQRKRWEDNIREWTGLEFAESQKAEENREKWKKLVVKLSVVPKRPPRLRDR